MLFLFFAIAALAASPQPSIPLFRAYPSLQKDIPRIQILEGPTPVEPLAKLEADLLGSAAGRRLWVKRDDRSNALLGGNKARKLEFLIADAKKDGKHKLVTSGMYGSNHCLATAAAGRQFGLKTRLILGPQPVTADVKNKLLAFHALGAQMTYYSSENTMAVDLLESFIKGSMDGDTYYIPPGGSSKLGSLGYVNAFLELVDQVKLSGLPDQIIVPVGSGGTATGLLVGSCLSGAWEKTKIVGVGVQDAMLSNEREVRRDAWRTYRFIRAHLNAQDRAKMPRCDFMNSTKAFGFTEDYHGPEYGAAPPQVYEAIRLLNEVEGLHLDITYSGKAMRYFLDEVHSAKASGTPVPKSLFWLTYDSYDLTKVIDAFPWKNPKEKWKDLPRDFWRLFE